MDHFVFLKYFTCNFWMTMKWLVFCLHVQFSERSGLKKIKYIIPNKKKVHKIECLHFSINAYHSLFVKTLMLPLPFYPQCIAHRRHSTTIHWIINATDLTGVRHKLFPLPPVKTATCCESSWFCSSPGQKVLVRKLTKVKVFEILTTVGLMHSWPTEVSKKK